MSDRKASGSGLARSEGGAVQPHGMTRTRGHGVPEQPWQRIVYRMCTCRLRACRVRVGQSSCSDSRRPFRRRGQPESVVAGRWALGAGRWAWEPGSLGAGGKRWTNAYRSPADLPPASCIATFLTFMLRRYCGHARYDTRPPLGTRSPPACSRKPKAQTPNSFSLRRDLRSRPRRVRPH